MHKNRFFGMLILAALLIAALFPQATQAGNLHFNGVTFSLGSLVAEGTLVGLGNQAAAVTLTAYGQVYALCQNKGGQQASGRNPILVDVQETAIYTTDSNGAARVEVIAPDPTFADLQPSPTPKQAGCPSGNWKVVSVVEGSTKWTAARIEVRDAAGLPQIDLSFTCTTLFVNGVATDVACEENS